MLSHAALLATLIYDPATGWFTAKHDRRRWVAGQRVGTTRPTGYRQVCLFGKIYLEHRLAWFYVHGTWPAAGLDHRNRVRGDNSISNLREATQSQNHQNRSGVAGFIRSAAKSERWVARVIVDGKTHVIGAFDTKADAHEAYLVAKRSLHAFNPVTEEN